MDHIILEGSGAMEADSTTKKKAKRDDEERSDSDGDDNNVDGDEGVVKEAKTAKDTVAPLWNVPYNEQVHRKNDLMKAAMIRMTRKLRKQVSIYVIHTYHCDLHVMIL